MELVAFLGNDAENWGQIIALIKHGNWDKILLIKNKNAQEFPSLNNVSFLEINSEKGISEITEILKDKLKEELSGDFEVALSLASGNGKEHMALLSALLNIPVGVKIVAYTKEGIKFLS